MNKRFALTAALTVALTIATIVGAEPNAPAGVAQAATSQATVTGKTLPAPVPKTGQTTSFAKGDDGNLMSGVAWPKPRTDPLSCRDYQVVVNGRPVTVHGAKSCQAPFPFKVFPAGTHPGIKLARKGAWGGPAQIAEAGNAPYAFACFPVEGPVSVEIRSSLPLDKVQVRPARAATVERVDKHTLTLRLDGPAKLSVEPDGRHGGLLLFADEPETEIPDADDPKVHYYGPGLHRAGVIELKDGETLYLAPGAVVEGGIRANKAKDIRILGRGILCGDPWGWRAGPQPHMVMFKDVENLHMEGIVLRCSWQWTISPRGCRNVTIRNVKVCQGKNLNDDGINPTNSSDVLIEDCFIRTIDDNFSPKGYLNDRRPCERIVIRRCLLWSDLARVVMIGPETRADRIGDIHMHDCEVLYRGPPVQKIGFGDWNRSSPVFAIQAAQDCLVEDILIENVRVHQEEDHHEKTGIKIEPSLPHTEGKPYTMGRLRNITFRNIEFLGPWQPRISIWGKDAEHDVRGVRFENVRIAGVPLDASYPQLSISEQYAADITFEKLEHNPLKHINLPVVDLSKQTERHVFVARGNQIEWNGHPSTVLLPDGKTIFCVWQGRRDGTNRHEAPAAYMKRSDDGGQTWSDEIDLPANWLEIGRGAPTIHRLVDAQGKARLFVFCRTEDRTTFLQGVSEDDGRTWSELRPVATAKPEVGPITGWTAPITILESTAPDGRRRHLMWYEHGRDGDSYDRVQRKLGVVPHPEPGVIWQSASYDGGLTWGESKPVVDRAGACEPACVRSPDGKQLLLLIRNESRQVNSLMATSDNEGETWSVPRELPLALTGDRFLPRYAPDGRLVIVFRPMPDRLEKGKLKAPWAYPDGYCTAWVGRYEDIIAGREGECLIRLLRSYRGGDHTYPGLELLPDGTFVATTYIQYRPGNELHSVVSVRFRLEDIQPEKSHR